ncbi:hypothetical protein B0H14DRAFT_2601907 [Mycena olivaceomarginata]|nr:hypothetical protein B0H14DRAFT_2601907 [Mycena olivaceomarginata]
MFAYPPSRSSPSPVAPEAMTTSSAPALILSADNSVVRRRRVPRQVEENSHVVVQNSIPDPVDDHHAEASEVHVSVGQVIPDLTERLARTVGKYLCIVHMFIIAPPFVHDEADVWSLERLDHRLSAFQSWVLTANGALLAAPAAILALSSISSSPAAQGFVILAGIFAMFGVIYTILLVFHIGERKTQFLLLVNPQSSIFANHSWGPKPGIYSPPLDQFDRSGCESRRRYKTLPSSTYFNWEHSRLCLCGARLQAPPQARDLYLDPLTNLRPESSCPSITNYTLLLFPKYNEHGVRLGAWEVQGQEEGGAGEDQCCCAAFGVVQLYEKRAWGIRIVGERARKGTLAAGETTIERIWKCLGSSEENMARDWLGTHKVGARVGTSNLFGGTANRRTETRRSSTKTDKWRGGRTIVLSHAENQGIPADSQEFKTAIRSSTARPSAIQSGNKGDPPRHLRTSPPWQLPRNRTRELEARAWLQANLVQEVHRLLSFEDEGRQVVGAAPDRKNNLFEVIGVCDMEDKVQTRSTIVPGAVRVPDSTIAFHASAKILRTPGVTKIILLVTGLPQKHNRVG